VINDNGGTAAAGSFSGTITGTATFAGGNTWTGTVSPGQNKAMTAAGNYNVVETAYPGYTASYSADCTGTIALGQTKYCTVTNDDQPAHLTLLKAVNNTFGGTAGLSSFLLTAAGPTPVSGVVGGSTAASNVAVNAGVYTLTETQLYGYTLQSLICVGGRQTANSLTLALGESATCTFTNVDLPGRIVINKVTKPANTGSFAFTTTGTGYSNFSLPGGGSNGQNLSAGTYTVKETTQLGWILTGIGGSTDPNTPYNCVVTGSGGSTGVGDLNTQTASITLKNGDTVTCTFENTGNGATRTQGFWATHSQLANIAWFGGTAFGHTFPGVVNVGLIGDTQICGRPLDTLGKVEGGFWSDVSKTSTSAKRSVLDQARMQLLQQLLAAELNASAFGSVPSGATPFADMESALCGTNTNVIKNAQQAAASFNTTGDSSTFTPGTSADSKNSRSVANIPFWDIIKP
jgi:hypothetical protein